MKKIKKIIRLFTPPIINKLIKVVFVKMKNNNSINLGGWFGNYETWKEAEKNSLGYNEDNILNVVKNAVFKVKTGEAVYERDSVLFPKKEYSWPLLSNLLWVTSINKNELKVIDFGGSLGSTYFQNKDFFNHLKVFNWNIVEQNNFVKEGKLHFEDGNLKFFYTIDEVLEKDKCNIIILSSVIQYIENPYELISQLIKYNFEYILFDRTSFISNKKHLIAKQIVPENIYEASYPIHFFNEEEFLSSFSGYEMINEFKSYCEPERYNLDEATYGYWKGFMLKKINK